MKKTLTLSWDDDEPDGTDRLQRMLRADDAFHRLSELDEKLRGIIKHDDSYDDRTIKLLEELRSMIHEDGLMELWG